MLYHSSCRLQLKLPPLAVSTVKKERPVLFRARRPGSLPVGLLTYSLADGHCESLPRRHPLAKVKEEFTDNSEPRGSERGGEGVDKVRVSDLSTDLFFFFF